MAPGSIASVYQLKGRKIGVSNIGSTSDIATRVMFSKVGLDPEKDVTIVAVGSLQNRMRYPLEVFDAVREVVPADKPVGIKVSSTDSKCAWASRSSKAALSGFASCRYAWASR